MGKSKSQKQDVVDYRMSIHFGISSTVDGLSGIYVNEKTVWEGWAPTYMPISIYQPELFGGVKKEGGLVGFAHFLPGNQSQVMPEALAAKLGRTSDTCPGFRGLSSIFFAGSYEGSGNFLWTSNNPIVAQSVWCRVSRWPMGLDFTKAIINGTDANPAHMIFDCLTSSDWGMGAPTTIIDVPSFEACGDTLFDEDFGLSMIWTQQAKIEDFISEILDHIQAMLYVNPRTGLLTLKLVRDDYDVGTLRTMGPDDADLLSFQRKMWGETVNEIVVTWTNPQNEQEETVSIQDLANISVQGAPITDSRNYYGVRNKSLASRLAARDLRISSAPLATVEVELNRTAWDLLPGEVVLFSWPEYGLINVVMRVGTVNYGKPGDGTIKATLLEDVFSLERPIPNLPPDTSWEKPGEDPAPMAATQVITLPAYFVASTDFQGGEIPLTYPEVVAAILAFQSGSDTESYDLLSEEVLPNGVVSFTQAGSKNTLGRKVLVDPWAAEPQTVLPAALVTDPLKGPKVGGFVFIGDVIAGSGPPATGTPELLLSGETGSLLLSGDQSGNLLLSGDGGSDLTPTPVGESGMEIALVDSYDGTNFVLSRGILDTIPHAWPAGTPIWFVNQGVRIVDDKTIRSAGETVDYKLLSRTSKGVLAEADAPIVTGTLSARPHLPYRPANVKVNGVGFGSVAVTSGDINITWATRNREMEDGQVMKWTDGPTAPEYLQETVVTVLNPDGTVVYQQTGLWTATALSLPSAYFARWVYVDIMVRARRGGLWSLQGHQIRVTGLAGNTEAPAPPAAPAPGPAPAQGPSPNVGNWTVTPITYESDGGSVPALLLEGSPTDNPDAEGIVVELREEVGPEAAYWDTIMEGPITTRRVPITQVKGGGSYFVAVSYRQNGLIGERLVIGPVSTAPLSIPSSGPGTVSTPVSISFMANQGVGQTNHLVAETADMEVPAAGGQLSVTLNGVVSAEVTSGAVGSWSLRKVVGATETVLATGTCSYNQTYVTGDVVGDFSKVNALLFPVTAGSVKLRLYVNGGGPISGSTGTVEGALMGVVYSN